MREHSEKPLWAKVDYLKSLGMGACDYGGNLVMARPDPRDVTKLRVTVFAGNPSFRRLRSYISRHASWVYR